LIPGGSQWSECIAMVAFVVYFQMRLDFPSWPPWVRIPSPAPFLFSGLAGNTPSNSVSNRLYLETKWRLRFGQCAFLGLLRLWMPAEDSAGILSQRQSLGVPDRSPLPRSKRRRQDERQKSNESQSDPLYETRVRNMGEPSKWRAHQFASVSPGV